MKSRYVMFAAYNRWANERLCGAAAALPDDDYRADRGAFFKSMHGTLNHLLTAITGDAPSLDLIVFQRETGLGALRVLA